MVVCSRKNGWWKIKRERKKPLEEERDIEHHEFVRLAAWGSKKKKPSKKAGLFIKLLY